MWKYKYNSLNYEQLHTFMQYGRYGSERNPKLSPDRPAAWGRATRLRLVGVDSPVPASERPDIALWHYETPIVTWHADNDTATLYTGDWASPSTNRRINYYARQFLPGSLFVQKGTLWFGRVVGQTPVKEIKCPECHHWADPEDDAHIVQRLQGGECERCTRNNRCSRCMQTGMASIGGNRLYMSWDGGPTRFRRGGEEA